MKHKEAKSNTILNQYLREKRKEGFYCYYELKEPKGKSFSFKSIEENQDEGLPALENNGLVWKWSDEDSRKKPCDGASLPPLPSYLIIKFKKAFYFIRYSRVTYLKSQNIKSMTEEDCQKHAEKVFHTG